MRKALIKIVVASGVENAAGEKIEEASSHEEESRQKRNRKKFCTRYTN